MQPCELTYAQELPVHASSIESINAEAFGPARFTRAAHLIREAGGHDLALSFVTLSARDGDSDEVIASVRQTHIVVGSAKALMLGPLAVRPQWKKRGIGAALMQMALKAAADAGYEMVVLVGDAPYYAPFGFVKIPENRVTLPAPVDPNRLLVCEIKPGAAQNLAGMVRHAGRR